MTNIAIKGWALLATLAVLMGLVGSTGMQMEAFAQTGLPDLAPMGIDDDRVTFRPTITQRLGGNTLEFSILTANIGDRDFERPRDPDTGAFLLPQIYEFTLYNLQDGEWVEVDRRRKNTICTIDDTRRGNVFPCIQEHGATHTCSTFNQGISRGWADDYFRGLNGQWVFIGDNTGSFWLQAELDPDLDLQRQDIPDSGKDATHDNNYIDFYFNFDGTTLTVQEEVLYLTPPCE